MKEDICNTFEVNPVWFRQHLLWLLNRIRDICNDQIQISAKERLILIDGLIEYEVFRCQGTWEYLMGDEVKPKRKKKTHKT